MHKRSFSLRGLPYSLRARVLLAFAFVMAGCGSGETLLGGTAWLPVDMPCPPGQTPVHGGTLNGGSCHSAGVPPDGCGQGFEHDGKDGCNPILPPDPCPPGQMAVPGDTQCHEVAPCGSGDYGLIPVDADTQFVNAAYPGNDSDGTQARPWRRIQDALDSVRSGAIVAVAAGTYVENLWIRSRPIRLWGRCPALVEVVGTASCAVALEIASNHSEVHHIAITGPGGGILAAGSSEVLVDHVWIHDTGSTGIGVRPDKYGPASMRISGSLIETTNEVGVNIEGSHATIEATVVRSTQPRSHGMLGVGIKIRDSLGWYWPGTLTLRTSLLEQNHGMGVFAISADATIETTVVRDTQQTSDGMAGHGIEIQFDPTTYGPATLALRTSLLENNHDIGLFVSGSDATIESTVVRSTHAGSATMFGAGIGIYNGGHERGALTLRSSLLEHNNRIGVFVVGSDAMIESTVVRDTQQSSDGTNGRGILIQDNNTGNARATLTLGTSLVEENHGVGVFVIGSDATIETTLVQNTRPNSDGTFGDGIAVASYGYPAMATIRSTHVKANARAGISNFSAAIILSSSTVQCNGFDIDGEQSVPGQPFTFDGSKGNLCGCGEKPDPYCAVVSAGLSPPLPIP